MSLRFATNFWFPSKSSCCGIYRDVRVQILIWFQTFLLFAKPHFQTFDALKSTSSQAFQIISDFFFSDALTPLYTLNSSTHICKVVQSFCGLTEIKLQQKWFLRQIYLKSLPNNISKIGQNRTWGNMIICINNNVCFCLYGNDEALNWANNVISHSFLELDNITR